MSGYGRNDDNLAYGEYHGDPNEAQEGERGFIGDVGRRFFGGSKPDQQASSCRTNVYVSYAC